MAKKKRKTDPRILGDCRAGDIVVIDGKRYRCMIKHWGGGWSLRRVLSPESVSPASMLWKESKAHLYMEDETPVEIFKQSGAEAGGAGEEFDPLMG